MDKGKGGDKAMIEAIAIGMIGGLIVWVVCFLFKIDKR